MADKVANAVGAIIALATVAVVVGSPRTAGLVRAVASGLAQSIDAATRPAR